ncbi:MAG: hypothetical protein K0R47_300 [Brevibacillus sp.]|nr:hypothetical protein [Brevibacillus sp.]
MSHWQQSSDWNNYGRLYRKKSSSPSDIVRSVPSKKSYRLEMKVVD